MAGVPRIDGDGGDPTPVVGRLPRAAIPAAAGVVALALAALVLAGRGAHQATTRGITAFASPAVAESRQVASYESVRRQLRSQVPPGARVYVDRSVGWAWDQRIPEFATLEGIYVVADAAGAGYRLSIAPGPDGGDIPVLVVTRLR